MRNPSGSLNVASSKPFFVGSFFLRKNNLGKSTFRASLDEFPTEILSFFCSLPRIEPLADRDRRPP